MPKGERRERGISLPGRAERGRVAREAIEAERGAGLLELAVPEATKDPGLAGTEDDEIGPAVAIDVDRVGAVDGRQVGDRVRDPRERESSADGAVVPEQRGAVGTARDVQVRTAVVVAVEHGHAAAYGILEAAVEALAEAGRGRLVDEVRCAGGNRRPGSKHQHAGPARHGDEPDRDHSEHDAAARQLHRVTRA